MREYLYLDFEYNDDLVLCCAITDDKQEWFFDTRNDGQELAQFIEGHSDAVYVAFAAQAEQESLWRLGIEPPRDWFDIMPEAAQIVYTHPLFRTVEVEDEDGLPFFVNHSHLNLLKARQLFLGEDTNAAKVTKDDTRDLILSQSEWTAEEFERIRSYCWEDVRCLPELHRFIVNFHEAVGSPWLETDAIYRGRSINNATKLLHHSPGFPVDETWLSSIYENRVMIIHSEIDKVNRLYPNFTLLRKTADGGREDVKECGRYAESNQLPWDRTKTDRVIMRADYLDTFVKSSPELKAFKECRDLIIQLRKNRWTEGNAKDHQRPLIQDGHVKAVSLPFYAKTGRSQPIVNRGHILNARPFIRTAIRPPEGKVICGLDWSQQEIAIALAFFPDAALQSAYDSGDIYRALAVRAAALPASVLEKVDGELPKISKADALVRQQFKSTQLGLGFGMAEPALGKKIFADVNAGADTLIITLDDAMERAEEILEWHKSEFADYWDAVEDFVEDVRTRGFWLSPDHWLYFADDDTKTTQLQNIRMQSSAATMMHYTLNDLAKIEIDFLAEHHDAIYFYADEGDAQAKVFEVRQIMDKAVRNVIGDRVKIRIDASIYTHETGYTDPRAYETVKLLKTHLETMGEL